MNELIHWPSFFSGAIIGISIGALLVGVILKYLDSR